MVFCFFEKSSCKIKVLTQQRELEDRLKESYIERKMLYRWALEDDLIKVITGPRRSGKSFYGLHLIHLMTNMAREYSLNALSGVTRCRSVPTVDKYIRYLQEAYLVFSLKRFSFKLKNQAGQNKKIYCTDNGLAVSAGFRFSANRGSLYENLVAIALEKAEIAGRISVFYWKGAQNEEVDFVVKEGLTIAQLIQVCADISNPKTLKREMRALIKASQELNCDDLLLLNDSIDGVVTLKWQDVERRIRLMPLWQWLEQRI
jgi:hypothetical protein